MGEGGDGVRTLHLAYEDGMHYNSVRMAVREKGGGGAARRRLQHAYKAGQHLPQQPLTATAAWQAGGASPSPCGTCTLAKTIMYGGVMQEGGSRGFTGQALQRGAPI